VIPCVLSLCDRTGNMVRPWAEAGFRCFCVDIQHPAGWTDLAPGVVAIGADVLADSFPGWVRADLTPLIAFAFPPCTHLAGSGARWFVTKGLPPLIEALQIVDRCREVCEAAGCPWLIENPVGRLSTCWRKPDYTFDPCDFGGYLTPEGDHYTKKTCLWTGGGFVMPRPRPVMPIEGSKIHLLPPSPDRANLRSETPMGFARAVFEANRHLAEARAA
jgi:hypothetical protein